MKVPVERTGQAITMDTWKYTTLELGEAVVVSDDDGDNVICDECWGRQGHLETKIKDGVKLVHLHFDSVSKVQDVRLTTPVPGTICDRCRKYAKITIWDGEEWLSEHGAFFVDVSGMAVLPDECSLMRMRGYVAEAAKHGSVVVMVGNRPVTVYLPRQWKRIKI